MVTKLDATEKLDLRMNLREATAKCYTNWIVRGRAFYAHCPSLRTEKRMEKIHMNRL